MTSAAGLHPSYPLATERLLLRPHRMSDLDDLLLFHGDPDVVRFLPWPLRDRTATEQVLRAKLDQVALVEPGQWLVLAVELRETATVVGEVLLKWTSDEHRQGELGFAFARAQHGRGLAAEAAAAMLRLGFDELALHRITAVCIEQNEGSARLLRRLGFARQARLVDNIWFKGAWATQLVYALSEDVWRAGTGIASCADSDVEQIRGLVRCFFAAFTSGHGVDDRLAALRSIVLPNAVFVRTCGPSPAVYDVESFLAPRRAMLTDGTLTEFTEHATHGRLDVFGDIAHWFGRYAKDGVLAGAPYSGGGMKSIQFARTGAGWRISAAAWDDDRPDLSPDDHYVTEDAT